MSGFLLPSVRYLWTPFSFPWVNNTSTNKGWWDITKCMWYFLERNGRIWKDRIAQHSYLYIGSEWKWWDGVGYYRCLSEAVSMRWSRSDYLMILCAFVRWRELWYLCTYTLTLLRRCYFNVSTKVIRGRNQGDPESYLEVPLLGVVPDANYIWGPRKRQSNIREYRRFSAKLT